MDKDKDEFVLLDDCERTLNFIDNYGHKGKLGWFKNDHDDDYDDDSSMMIMRITGRMQGVFDSGQSGASMGRKLHSTWTFVYQFFLWININYLIN